jgi:glycogen phosphorylase
MLSDALPIYSGGLGNVAGDQLKSASDLGIPVIGVGLLYQSGYFRQHIDAQGRQLALYPFNDPGQLPVTPLRDRDGEWLYVLLDFPGFRLRVRTWQVEVGGTKLYLLDTNDPANLPEHRGITSELRRRLAHQTPAGAGPRHRRMASAARAGHQAGDPALERRPRRVRGAGACAGLDGR